MWQESWPRPWHEIAREAHEVPALEAGECQRASMNMELMNMELMPGSEMVFLGGYIIADGLQELVIQLWGIGR